MDLVVKARDPKDGATVMVTCPSGREALAMLERLRQERLKIIGITDRQGKSFLRATSLLPLVASVVPCRPEIAATGRERIRRG
jgi:DNA-binding MurR/RpiR family transcriptional regulator